MKTKIFFLMIFIITNSWITSASVVHVYLNNTGTQEWHYFCGVDSIIIHKPSNAMTNIIWTTPGGTIIPNEDSVIVTSSNTGSWSFFSTEVSKLFYVDILSSPPIEPTCMATDTSFCTASFSLQLDAQNQNPGGHAASYQWSTGQTNRIITVTTPGTYTVTITNACGADTFDITITQSNPNAPNLGPDQIFCWGSSSVLNPGSTNVATYQWSTGETTPTITVDTTGTYWVYVVDNAGCSGRDTVQITALVPIDEKICYVEFDTLTWKNNINWTSNLPGNADSVRIYKEVSLNVWNLIGTVHQSIDHYLDTASVPQAQSYSYKIAIVDTCGNESAMSPHHTTITLMSAYDALSNTYGFTWSAYDGLVVQDYYLFGIDSTNAITQVASVPSNIYMYNYLYPNPSFVKYFVGFETPDCDAKTNVLVKSNWVMRDSLLTGMQETEMIAFNVYPNPASDQLNISIKTNEFQVEVLTLLGQVVLTEYNTKVLNVSNLPQGTYIISIIVDGIHTYKLFTKQ